MNCELWSINRWLRWTGFRLYVEVDLERTQKEQAGEDYEPTRIGLRFFGWKNL